MSDNAHHQERFDLFRAALISGKSWVFDRQSDCLAFDALDELSKLLRAGEPSRETLNILADFLQSIATEAGQSTHAWKANELLAYRVLGRKPNGRNGKGFYLQRALAAFEALTQDGATQDEAERAAYDEYFEGEGRTYAGDSINKESLRRKGARYKTKAENEMVTVIRPLLVRAALLPKVGPGRKKKPK